jgi:GT2 family glycosyltransferase
MKAVSETMLVSVIIVTRNRSSNVSCCLDSIMTQGYTQKEIIVVDNASTDGSAEMIRTRYPSVTVLTQQANMGAAEGRNIGIRRARGDVCICVDDDTELLDNRAIEQCLVYFARDPKLACVSMRVIDQHGAIVTKLIPRRDRKVITEDTPGALFSATGFAMRRNAFFDAGEFWNMLSPYFGEEPDLSYRLIEKGYNILLTPHISVRHHESPNERYAGRRLYYGTRNTPWFALRSLPWYSVIGLTILTWGYFFLVALKDWQLGIFFKAIAESLHRLPEVYRIRQPISQRTRHMIWKYSGLILF